MEAECKKYIIELHVFIESWLKGSIEKSKSEFQHFEAALDERFVIVHPSGETQTKSEIVSGFWLAHGSQKEKFSIEIQSLQVRSRLENICILTYEEWQAGAKNSVRISTVVFKKLENNYTWLHLHETWRHT